MVSRNVEQRSVPARRSPTEGDLMRGREHFRKMMILATVVLVAGAPLTALGAATPAQKCAAAKRKAAAKKITAELKCYQAAVQAGAVVDANCLATAETKFTQSIAKAEANGGCATTG